MTVFMDLPNELILHIFSSSSTVHTATQLSQVSRRVQLVWLKNQDQIIRSVLEPQMPAYDDAIALARTQAGFDMSLELSDVPTAAWVPRVLQNAERADGVVHKHESWIKSLPADNHRHKEAYTCQWSSYYTVRQLVLSYHHPELRTGLRAMLKSQPVPMLKTHMEIAGFMLVWLPNTEGGKEERARHDMQKDEEDWDPDDEVNDLPNKFEWDFAYEECHHAWVVATCGHCGLYSDTHECGW